MRKRDEGYKVIDVSVEGISMLHTHRVEFASVVNRKGIDGLLDDLRGAGRGAGRGRCGIARRGNRIAPFAAGANFRRARVC